MQKPPSSRATRCSRAVSSRPARRTLSFLAALSALLSIPAPARAQFTVTGETSINYGGTATNHAGTSYIGIYGNSTGTATLAGGATRNLEGGFFLGYNAGDSGTINVTGAGTVWTFAGTRRTSYIGYTGTGALNINDSGRMNYTGGLSIGAYSAYSSTTPATLTIASGGILATTSGITMGVFGGTNSAAISVSGAGSLLSVGGGIQFDANSSLTVNAGAQATFTKITMNGDATTATTTSLLVSGAGSLVSATGDLRVGTGSTGIGNLTVTDGGKLRAGGTFTMNRGTIKVGDGAAPGYLDTGAIVGYAGGGSPNIEFNHTSSNYSFANDAGTGIALENVYLGVKVLAGTTLFTANSSYGGGTTITGGTLKILNEPSSAGASGIGYGPITIGAAGTLIFGTGGTSGTLSGVSAIANNGQLTFNRSDALTLNGAISGSGSITKLGAGDLTLGGNNAAYAGTLTFSGTTLTVEHVNALGSAAGATVLAPGAALKFRVNGTIVRPITLSGTGSDGTGALVGWGNTTLAGPVTLAGNTAFSTTGNLTVTGVIGESVASSGLTKLGYGILTLANANTYTGNTTISAGIVNAQHSGALGAGTGGVTVATGTALQLQGNATFSGHDLTLNSYGYSSNNGALRNVAGSNTWGGNVTVASASRIHTDAGSVLTITGGLKGGDLDLAKHGAGTLVLGGAGTFLGNVTINDGTLTLDHSHALQSATVTLSSGTLSFGNLTAATLGGLSGTSPLSLTNASSDGVTLTINSVHNSIYSSVLSGAGSLVKTGSGTFSLSGNNTFTGTTLISEGTLNIGSLSLQYSPVALASTGTLSFGSSAATLGGLSGAGNISLTSHSLDLTVNTAATSSYDGALSGYVSLTKAGTGTLTLTGDNTYTGTTSVNEGSLFVNGSLANTAVSIAANATLGGSGTIGGLATFASGAHLAPGNSPGTLTFTSGLGLVAGSILDFELGLTSDSIRVSGGTLTGPGSGHVTIDLADAGGFDPLTGGTYVLFDFSGATLMDLDLTDFTFGTLLAGTSLSGYSLSLNLTAHTLSLTYAAGASAIPEPSTYAVFFGIAALAAAWRRRTLRRPVAP